jgi:hypothetical protein
MLDRHARLVARNIRTEAYFHEARVLVLIVAFSANGSGVPGLDVLARLDFLLRFPTILDRVRSPGPMWPGTLAAGPAERQAITAAFAPAHYGLWSDRYRLITGALAGRHLIVVPADRNPSGFVASGSGQRTAQHLTESAAWGRTGARADFLYEHLPVVADQLDDLIRPALVQVSTHQTSDHTLTRRPEPREDGGEWHLGEEDGL